MHKINSRKFCSLLLFFSTIIFSQNVITAQENIESQPNENWVLEYGLHYEPQMNFRYENYSVADTVKFREKLKLINSLNSSNEWEGNYSVGIESAVSIPQFRWNSNAGFIEYYIDTCYPSLESINYGNILNTPEYIELLPEKIEDSPRKVVPSRYVKVKWGKDFYLVKESSLQAFAEKAVGLYIEPENTENENFQTWSDFMVKGNEENLSKFLPEFSPSYRRFQRSPIEAKILNVGKRTVEKEKILGETIYGGDTAFYAVTIDAGKTKNVKVGMKFDIPDTKEELVITKVNQNSSVGLVSRSIDDNKNDLCHDDNYESTLCPQIKSSFKVKTQIGRFLY